MIGSNAKPVQPLSSPSGGLTWFGLIVILASVAIVAVIVVGIVAFVRGTRAKR